MAKKSELDAIGQHQVFADFMDLAEGGKALPSISVWMIKSDGAANGQQFKATLVSGGNHQIKGIDYEATDALTARFDHVMLALTIAAKYDVAIHQIDICMAFLGLDIEEEIYLHP